MDRWTFADIPDQTGRTAIVTGANSWKDGRFENPQPLHNDTWGALRDVTFGGSDHRTPKGPVPVEALDASRFVTAPQSGLRVTWLGHSTWVDRARRACPRGGSLVGSICDCPETRPEHRARRAAGVGALVAGRALEDRGRGPHRPHRDRGLFVHAHDRNEPRRLLSEAQGAGVGSAVRRYGI
jgi:hypothetical protein